MDQGIKRMTLTPFFISMSIVSVIFPWHPYPMNRKSLSWPQQPVRAIRLCRNITQRWTYYRCNIHIWNMQNILIGHISVEVENHTYAILSKEYKGFPYLFKSSLYKIKKKLLKDKNTLTTTFYLFFFQENM